MTRHAQRTRRTAGIAILLLLLLASPAAAAITVGADGADWPTINDAILHASEGDTIVVHSGAYEEEIVLDRTLTLIGRDTGGGMPVIASPACMAAILIKAPDCTLENLEVSGDAECGVLVSADTTRIRGLTISGMDRGILLSSCTGARIEKCTITGCDQSALALASASSATITHNQVTGNGRGISIDRQSTGTTIFANLFDNSQNAYSLAPETCWESDRLSYTFQGTEYTGTLGNFWSDYWGKDSDGDGVGDEAYLGRWPAGEAAGTTAGLNEIKDPSPLVAHPEKYAIISGALMGAEAETRSVVRAERTPLAEPLKGEQEETATPIFARNNAVSIFILFAGVSGLALAALIFAGKRRSARYRCTCSANANLVYTIGYAILCAAFALLSTAVLAAVKQAGNAGSPGALAAAIAFLLAYLAASALLLAWSTHKKRPVVLVHRLHPLAALLTLLLVLVLALILDRAHLAGDLRSFLVLLPLSIILPLHHLRSLKPAGEESRTTVAPAVAAAASTVIAGAIGDRGNYAVTAAHFPADLAGKYTDIQYIGKGGTARVFRAIRQADGREVAVKVPLNFDEVTGRCFLKEMRIWEDLHHPNIVDLHSVNILPSPFVEMEFMHHSLDAVPKPVNTAEALDIVVDVAEGLAYAHGKGMIHRDIKPHNILLTREGIAKISDWGLGKIMSDARETSIVGFSLTYAAPEQIAPRRFGTPDARTDLYQLGVVLYELLTGIPPFEADNLGEFSEAILNEEPRPPSAFDPALAPFDAVVGRCLAKHPDDRYASADELRKDLLRIGEGATAGDEEHEA